jgi:mannose-6-phosphate isomerase class I
VGSRAKSREELEQKVKRGCWEELLNRVPISKGDFLRVDPGTIHAITAGVELLEVQQNSDVTYRLYDYERLQNGKARELHLNEGLEVAKVPYRMNASDVIHTDTGDNISQLLADTDKYRMWAIKVNGRGAQETDSFEENTFLIGSILEGDGVIDGHMVTKGMHFIVPAGYRMEQLKGRMRLVLVAAK